MPAFSDTTVGFPISGSNQPPAVYLRVIQQATSASVGFAYHQGGTMTGSLLLAPRNANRIRFAILNSGSLVAGVSHGIPFDPRTNPPVPGNAWDTLILGTVTLQGNQGVTPSLEFEGKLPCYTGPVYVSWFGSGTLSGSTALMTEFVAG